MSTFDVLRAWVLMGLAHPADYAHVFIEQTQLAWNPYACEKVYGNRVYKDRETSLFAFDWEEPAVSESLAPPLLDALRAVATTLSLQNIPLLSLLVSMPFYLWMLALLLARAIVTKDRALVCPCVLFAALGAMALLGPCQLMRYYLYLVFALPLIVAMLLRLRTSSPSSP